MKIPCIQFCLKKVMWITSELINTTLKYLNRNKCPLFAQLNIYVHNYIVSLVTFNFQNNLNATYKGLSIALSAHQAVADLK